MNSALCRLCLIGAVLIVPPSAVCTGFKRCDTGEVMAVAPCVVHSEFHVAPRVPPSHRQHNSGGSSRSSQHGEFRCSWLRITTLLLPHRPVRYTNWPYLEHVKCPSTSTSQLCKRNRKKCAQNGVDRAEHSIIHGALGGGFSCDQSVARQDEGHQGKLGSNGGVQRRCYRAGAQLCSRCACITLNCRRNSSEIDVRPLIELTGEKQRLWTASVDSGTYGALKAKYLEHEISLVHGRIVFSAAPNNVERCCAAALKED